ncbi:alpha/beta hydrolase fold domain-containing protein [Comamonas sp.]|uniref:alpha/beta hydrolase fold domain-containing protein n=1 Tax=Comamonas sp. TaxID=34028 RepID=UPI00345B71F7
MAGDSEGGNLAAAACLLARHAEAWAPVIAHHLRMYPALDAGMDLPCFDLFGEGHCLSRSAMAYCYEAYLADPAQRWLEQVSPLRAASLAGLPPASVISCEYDALRDEAEAHARRLQNDGVPVRALRLLGRVHACIHMPGRSCCTPVAGCGEYRGAQVPFPDNLQPGPEAFL